MIRVSFLDTDAYWSIYSSTLLMTHRNRRTDTAREEGRRKEEGERNGQMK